MSWLKLVSRLIVGGLFIFSGLIKVNDPVGTAIKLEEYFAVFSSNFGSFFGWFEPYALYIGVFLVVLEVVLGIAVLINFKMPLTAWLLLALIVFFSILTFYSAYTGEVTDCGCFGDAIKLTPWESFTKDIILLVFILVLFVYRHTFKSILSESIGRVIMVAVTLIGLVLSVYAIRNLPFIDFRAYKVGADIPASMQPSAPLRYQYIMERDGEVFKFEQYPSDTTYVYKDVELLNPEDQPKITDYSVWNNDGDVTEQSFTGTQLLLVVHYVDKANLDAFKEINTLIGALESQMGVMVLTASDDASFDAFRHEVQLAAPYYFADATVLKTMVRSNPGVILLRNGVVLGKWHYRNAPTATQVLQLAHN